MITPSLRWRALAVLSLAGALVTVAVACGSDDPAATPSPPDGSTPDAAIADGSSSDTSVPDGGGDLAAFCKGTLGLYASMYEQCCDSNVAPKRYAFDDTLLKSVPLSCTTAVGKSVELGRATFVPAAATTCQTNTSGAIGARTCPDVLHAPSNQPKASIFDDAPGCADVIVGRQALDAPCANDYECADGLTCVGWTTTSDGVCKTPPSDGELCGYGIPDSGAFIELVKWGFGRHPRCADGFYCASTATQQGTCRPKASANGECDSADECAGDLRCQLGVCTADGPAPADAPCKRNSDCQDSLYCKRADGGSICAARAVAGTPCSSELSTECQGTCVEPDGGEATCVAYCGSL